MEVDGNFRRNAVLVLLNIGSLMLIFGSIYLTKELALFYGVGLGAAIQSSSDNASVASIVSTAAAQLSTSHRDLLESYVILLLSLAAVAASYTLLIKRNEKNRVFASKYTFLNAGMVIIYSLLMYLVLQDFTTNPHVWYFYVPAAGIVLCLLSDAYLEYDSRLHSDSRTARLRHTMSIDPSRPFSNMLNMQEAIFANLSGHLRIVDKHFNSTALANLHRLADKSVPNFTKITILTSKEMLDSGTSSDIADFRNELSGRGVGLEVKIMEEKDATEQHERIMLDDKVAYKIPPFNIINKRSEHITRISHEEAARRFNHLYGRATKLENYMVRRGREESSQQKPQELDQGKEQS